MPTSNDDIVSAARSDPLYVFPLLCDLLVLIRPIIMQFLKKLICSY